MLCKAHRHRHLSNAIEQDDQQAEEGEASNLLAIVGADGVDVGAQEQGGSNQPHDKDLEGLGLVDHNGTLDEGELPVHQGFPPLEACVYNSPVESCKSHTSGRGVITMGNVLCPASGDE